MLQGTHTRVREWVCVRASSLPTLATRITARHCPRFSDGGILRTWSSHGFPFLLVGVHPLVPDNTIYLRRCSPGTEGTKREGERWVFRVPHGPTSKSPVNEAWTRRWITIVFHFKTRKHIVAIGDSVESGHYVWNVPIFERKTFLKWNNLRISNLLQIYICP